MAEEEKSKEESEEKKYKEFKDEGKDPSEFSDKYKKFLKGGYEKEGYELSPIQVQDSYNLKEREAANKKGDSEESEAQTSVNLSELDWKELKNRLNVVYYFYMPKWSFFTKFHRNMKAYVDRECKTKSVGEVAKYAEKQYEKQNPDANKKGAKNQNPDANQNWDENQASGKNKWRIFALRTNRDNKKFANSNSRRNSMGSEQENEGQKGLDGKNNEKPTEVQEVNPEEELVAKGDE